jgi:hypothetical protein
MCSIKYFTTKSSTRYALFFIYLLVTLIDYERKDPNEFLRVSQFSKHICLFISFYIYLFFYIFFLPNLGFTTMFFDGSLMKTGAGAGLLLISPLGKHLRYVLRLHFPASNNVAEYEALVKGLWIAIELGVRRLDAHGDSQLVIDQVMKNSHHRDPKMEAYCDEVRCLEDKF